MFPVPDQAFGGGQTGYGWSGPALVAGLAAVTAGVPAHSALVVVVEGASQRCHEANDS
jgi:hypothetical protein